MPATSDVILSKVGGAALVIICQIALVIYPIAKRRLPSRKRTLAALRVAHWLHWIVATPYFIQFMIVLRDNELGVGLALIGAVMIGMSGLVLAIGALPKRDPA
jgi:hypothetical protein